MRTASFIDNRRWGRLVECGFHRRTVAALAVVVGLLFLCPVGQVQAQKETGVTITGNQATLKPGFNFKRVSESKLQIVQQSDDQGKRAVAVVGGLECGCVDPKTELFIFCDTIVSGGTGSCGTNSRCTCKPYSVGK